MDTHQILYEGYGPAWDPMVVALPAALFCGAFGMLAWAGAAACLSRPLPVLAAALCSLFIGAIIFILTFFMVSRRPRSYLRITREAVVGCGRCRPRGRLREFSLPPESVREISVNDADVIVRCDACDYRCRNLPYAWRAEGGWRQLQREDGNRLGIM